MSMEAYGLIDSLSVVGGLLTKEAASRTKKESIWICDRYIDSAFMRARSVERKRTRSLRNLLIGVCQAYTGPFGVFYPVTAPISKNDPENTQHSTTSRSQSILDRIEAGRRRQPGQKNRGGQYMLLTVHIDFSSLPYSAGAQLHSTAPAQK